MSKHYKKPIRYSSSNAAQVIRYFNAVKRYNKTIYDVRLIRASHMRKCGGSYYV